LKFRVYLAVLTILVGLAACKKQDGNIIIDGQSNNNQLEIFRSDSFQLMAKTIREDSLPANGISYTLLGEMNDPILGKSKASLFAKMNILEPENNFPNNIEPDSAILYIPMVDGLNFYGNALTKQRLQVFPLTDGITSKVYYQNENIAYNKQISANYYGPMFQQKLDSVGYRKEKMGLKPGLLIKLSAEFARSLMQMPSEAYQSNDGLAKHFKGIAIVPENDELMPGDGGYAVLDLSNVISLAYRAKIMLYYNDTSTFVFGFEGKVSNVNQGKVGPYPQFINDQLQNSQKSYTTTYIQALGGLKTEIQIPYLLNLIKDGNVAINKAEILFYTNEIASVNQFAPPRLNLYQPLNGLSKRNRLIDDATLSPATFGGVYDESRKCYRFTVTRHIQNILNDQYFRSLNTNLGLYLAVPSDNPVIGARAGIDHSKTKLIITYTKPN
jgi:hypothetical protein